METDLSLSSSDQPIEAISHGFSRQLDLQCDDASSSSSKLLPDTEVGVEEDDFTFMLVDTAIEGEFPLFDNKLLLDGEYEVEEIDRLPIQPPVDKIFIQSPYCVWSKESPTATAELSKKSNSTGFSKLWRLKDRGGRSNSYGRDAFVFFKSSSSDKKTTSTSTSASSSDGGKAKVVKQGTKGKKGTVSAHEAYLKSREQDRRRSYLPYRPELMGFFTNVHGGLTKNVHPY